MVSASSWPGEIAPLAAGATAVIALVLGVALLLTRRKAARAAREAAALQATLDSLRARQASYAVEHEAALRIAHERARFLADASHDLRQPMHAFGLFVAALNGEPQTPASAAMLERMGRALRGMDEMFQQVLDVSRIDSGAVSQRPRSFALAPLTAALEARLAPAARERGLRLRVACDRTLFVVTDPALVAELLTNLMTNAIRYTDHGGVLLACRPLGTTVRLQVCDSGRGIASAEQQRIFEPFVQLGNPSHDRRLGTGLGLAIVRRLADALGHRLTLRSAPGRGTRVTLVVPRDTDRTTVAADACDLDADADRTAELAGSLVLVVDDEIDVLMATRAALTAWGCHVLIARGSQEAVGSVQDSPRFPDLLITDHELEAECSDDVIEAVQAQLPSPVPVIVLSGGATPTHAPPAPGPDAATVRWLVKPVAAGALRTTLVAALGGQGPAQL